MLFFLFKRLVLLFLRIIFRKLSTLLKWVSHDGFMFIMTLILFVLLLSVWIYIHVLEFQYNYRGMTACSHVFSAAASQNIHSIQSLPLQKYDWIKYLKQDDWQPVTSSEQIYVYSAFYEKSNHDKIRIIGAIPTIGALTTPLLCILWYKDKNVTIKADLVNVNESQLSRFQVTYFLCYLCGQDAPLAVSLADEQHLMRPLNFLRVHDKNERTGYKFNFTVCVSPFSSHYNQTATFIEWIEMNMILGVNFFTFYNFNTSDSILQILNYYKSIGKAEVLPWSLPNVSLHRRTEVLDLHYYGQVAALNDCLHRNKGKSKFIGNFDLDEFIIPQLQSDVTWGDMLQRFPEESVYLFRSVHFILMKQIEESNDNYNRRYQNMPLKTLMILKRDNYIFNYYHRSKYIVRTKDAMTLGIHNVWALKRGSEYLVNPKIGMLHHYRSATLKRFDLVWNRKLDTVVRIFSPVLTLHNITLKYKKQLILNVNEAISNIHTTFK